MKTLPTLPRAALALSLLWLSAAGTAAGTGTERYDIPGHGTLALEVPVDWQAVYVLPSPEAMPGLRFAPLEGEAFQLSVSVFWHDGLDRDITEPEAVRELLRQVGEAVLAFAPGQSLELRPLDGAVHGWAFALEDPEPGEGGYPNLRQGALVLGDLVLAFTLLTRGPDAPEAEAALEMLLGARLLSAPRGI